MAVFKQNYFQRRTKPRGPRANYKIKKHSLAKIPVLLICGKKELDANTITIRRLGSEKQETMNLDKSIQYISSQNKAPLN